MLINKKIITTFFAGGVVIILLSILHFFSVFASCNHFINDSFMRYPIMPTQSEKLALIEIKVDDNNKLPEGDKIWLKLLDNLLAENAQQIIFNFLPSNVSEKFYTRAIESKKVIFGQRLFIKTDSIYTILNSLPKQVSRNKVDFGLIAETNQEGVYRSQERLIKVDDIEFPSLEFAAAKQLFGKKARAFKNEYLINFSGGVGRFFSIPLHSALARGAVKEYVDNKTVFIAVPDLENVSHFFTPIAGSAGQLSAVYFHAFALDTLLSKRELHPLSETLVYSLIAVITLCCLFVYHWFSLRISIFIAVNLSLLAIFTSWILLQQFCFVLPITEILLIQWLTIWIINRHRFVQKQHLLEKSLFDLSLKLQEKIFPVDFQKVDNPWTQLISMLNQTLHLQRLIFLERPETGQWVTEVKCFNCALDDINERRRDYQRAPYTTAIEQNCPVLVDMPYFKTTDEPELNYLAPLIFDNRLLGFWAFTIEPDKVFSENTFIAITKMYMAKIAETLYYYRVWKKRIQAENNKFSHYFKLQVNHNSYQILNKSIALLEMRISKLYRVFDDFNYGSILYDLFGRVILVNHTMETLLQSAELAVHEITLLDFFIKVTGFDEIKAQQTLQQMIFSQESFSFPTVNFTHQGNYTLYIKALSVNKEDIETLETRLILCELISH